MFQSLTNLLFASFDILLRLFSLFFYMIDIVTLDACIKRFAGEPDILAVWILGSSVMGRLRDDSDIDFAVHYKPEAKLDLNVHGALVCDLERILGRSVDIGRLDSRNLVYAREATQKGQLIFAKEQQEAMAFASRLQTMYLDLKQDRKIVEDAYCVG